MDSFANVNLIINHIHFDGALEGVKVARWIGNNTSVTRHINYITVKRNYNLRKYAFTLWILYASIVSLNFVLEYIHKS